MSEVTKYFEQRIEEWLQEEMAKDELFRKTVESKPQKTVKEACNYVLSVAKKTKQVGWDDSEVYGLVRHYYDEDDIKDVGDQCPSKIIVTGLVDLSESEKAEAMAQAVRNYEAELKKKDLEAKKKAEELEKERKAKLREKRVMETAVQGDLFGF